MTKIQFILHADFEQPGIITHWAKRVGFEYEISRPFAGDVLPDTTEFDWLILMGGPQSTKDRFPYLQNEIQLVKKALQNDIVVLGFCLGAQILGEALGAPAEKSPYKEIGLFSIELTDEGKLDPLLEMLPGVFPVIHWHNDMPGLTKEAKVLATSKGCPRQIVRYGSKAYGFQCHLEPTLQDIQQMIEHCADDLQPGAFVQTKQELLENDYSDVNDKMCIILDALVMQEESLQDLIDRL